MKNIQYIVDFFYGNVNYVKAALVFTLALTAAFNDIKYYKIPNKLNLTFVILGFMFNMLVGEIKSSFIGLMFPMILFPFFMARMMGAGDIKLFCAIGSIAGFPDIISIVCYCVLANGLIALVILLVRREKNGLKRLFYWFKNCLYTKKLVKYQVMDKNSKSIYRYAIGIAIGCIYYIVTDLIMGGTYALL